MKKTTEKKFIHLTSSPILPSYRWVNSLVVLARQMEKLGIDTPALLSGSRIHSDDLDNPDFYVTSEQERQVIRNIITLTTDPKIGLAIGQHYHIGIHGHLGIAAASSETLFDAARIFFQYMSLTLTHFQYDLKVKGKLAFMSMKELIDLKDLRTIICEREVVSVLRMTSDILGTAIPLKEVWFAYPKPSYSSAYQDVFKCPVRFNANEHMLVYDSKYLFVSLPLANPLLRKAYEKECRQLYFRLEMQETVTDRVRKEILFIKNGIPTLVKLAKHLNMSPRTLRRRLNEEGTSYKVLSADTLKNKAINLIQTTSQPIEQISLELGYSDLANFYRAFKRWTGHNPSFYRERD